MMTQEKNSATTFCRKCGRALDKEDKFGLCSDCTNKIGTPLITVGISALGAVVMKFVPKAMKLLISVIRH